MLIIACGGDGTISQIINGLAKTDTALEILPIGSGNDFVKSLGLNLSLSDYMDLLHKQHTTEIDLIRYEGNAVGWCANTIGIGVDGWANYYAHRNSWLKVRIIYYFGALKEIWNFRSSEITIQSEQSVVKDNFMMITACNGKWEGGSFLVAPDASVQDGFMDLLTIKKVPVFLLMLYLLRFRSGPAKWMKGVESNQIKKVSIFATVPLAVHRDGEHLNSAIRHLKIATEENALKIIVPENYWI